MNRRRRYLPIGLLTASLIFGSVTAASPAGAADPALVWAPCTAASLSEGGFECARLTVPRDRRQPAAGTFSLSLVRHRSTGTPGERIGSMVFNPGGPGGSGLSAMSTVWGSVASEEVKRHFDLVTWDPRGVGDSKPALEGCDGPFPVRPTVGRVDWAKVTRDFAARLSTVNAACQKANAAIIDHLGTVENVRDLDRIRAALGDSALTYWGMSYGTRIGYVYAATFPGRTRAIVLDGSIDPASTLLSLSEGGAAPDQAYGAWADAYPASAARLAAVLSVLNRRTVRLPDGTRLDRWTVRDLVFGNVAQQDAYATLAQVADAFHGAIFGTEEERQQSGLVAAQFARFQRDQPNSNAGGAFSVVNCLDYLKWPTLAQATAAVRDQVRLGPAYGGTLAASYSVMCSGLSVTPDPVPVITGDGPQVPVLVLGASRDGSTIQSWTGRMSRAFPRSRTVTYTGGQHVTWGFAGSACVDAVADAYVTTLALPAMDVGCPNTVVPQQ
jgi:pimeloyl-ACP methyl ester carboxylesterase